MTEILVTALLLACPLSMLAMGAAGLAATKLRRARDEHRTAPRTGGAEQTG
jgi:hypothetical protein